MKNMPLLVRRRFLPRCSPAMHRRCRLLVPSAVQRCREKFGQAQIGARTTLYWSGKSLSKLCDGQDRFCDGSDKV